MKKHLYLIVTATLFCQFSLGQTGLVWEDPVVVAGSSFDNTRPRIALLGNDVPVVLWGKMSTDVNYVSQWDGAAFGAPVKITQVGTDAFVSTWAGSEIATSGDTVFVVYKEDQAASGSIYTRRSLDGGATWNDTVKVDVINSLMSRFPSITTGVGGTPIVAFMEFDQGWADPRYVVSNSNDGGQSYLDPVQASDVFAPGEVCDCCPAEIFQGNGKQILFFRNNDNDHRDMWAISSGNGGAIFDQGNDMEFGTTMLSVCLSSGPTGIVSGDSIYYTWMSPVNGNARIEVGSATLNDLTPITNAPIDASVPSSSAQNFPRIAGMNDTLAIVWEQTISGSSECVVRWSVNGVQGLSAKDTVNLDLSGGQTNPDIAYSNGYFHFVWQNNSTNEVIYRRAQLAELTSIPEDYMNNKVEVHIGRSGGQLIISSTAPIRELSVFDVQGKSVGTLVGNGSSSLEWPVPANGTYLFNVLLEDGRSSTVKWSGAGQ